MSSSTEPGKEAEPVREQRVQGVQESLEPRETLQWDALRPERGLEVSFDHLQGSRLRQRGHFVRSRPPYELERISSSKSRSAQHRVDDIDNGIERILQEMIARPRQAVEREAE